MNIEVPKTNDDIYEFNSFYQQAMIEDPIFIEQKLLEEDFGLALLGKRNFFQEQDSIVFNDDLEQYFNSKTQDKDESNFDSQETYQKLNSQEMANWEVSTEIPLSHVEASQPQDSSKQDLPIQQVEDQQKFKRQKISSNQANLTKCCNKIFPSVASTFNEQPTRKREAKRATKQSKCFGAALNAKQLTKTKASKDIESSQSPVFCPPAQQEQGKLKLDQGYKSLLRGSRKAFKAAFEYFGLHTGKHHWSESRWFNQTKIFLEDKLQLKSLTDQEIYAAVVLLYPSFGPSNKKEERDLPVDNDVYRALGLSGMKKYKLIFDINNQELIQKFFNDQFIRKIWPAMMRFSKAEHFFNVSDETLLNLTTTFKQITYDLENIFKIQVPEIWKKHYPAQNINSKGKKTANKSRQ